jgi:hypothetical protein
MKIRTVEAGGRIDMMKLIVGIRNFANSPKNVVLFRSPCQKDATKQLKTSLNNALKNNIKRSKQAIALQALAGSEGSRRLRLSDFKTISTNIKRSTKIKS